jgi:hypothetical protein
MKHAFVALEGQEKGSMPTKGRESMAPGVNPPFLSLTLRASICRFP